MKTKTICLLILTANLIISCGGSITETKEKQETLSDSLGSIKSINTNEMDAQQFAAIVKDIPKDVTADSVARTLFYVLDSVNIPFSEASIELSTVHTKSYNGSGGFILSYEYSNEKERSATTTYNFGPKKSSGNGPKNISALWNPFKRKRKALEKVDFSSSLITTIKDAVDSKNKINDLGNQKYALDDFEVELSFVVTRTHEGKLEFKLWDKLGLGGGGSIENSYGHKMTIKFSN